MNRINNDVRSRKALEEKNAYVAVNFYLLLNLIFPLFQIIIIPKNKGKIKFNWKEK